MANFEAMSNAVIAGQKNKVKELTQQAIEEKVDANTIINDGLIHGMNIVGKQFKIGEMYVPEVLMSARAMNAGMELVKPQMVEGKLSSKGTIILGTVKGDLHDIGKNLVGMLMESAGFKVIDMGENVGADRFVEAIKENDVQVVAMSALLTTTMLAMKDTIELLKEEGLRDKVKVIVGGAPVSQDYADEIEADGFAPDAASATELVGRLLAAD